MVDPLLPSPVDNKGNDVECLTWWSSLEKKYPLVFKMIVVNLSIFDGPQVESSFSMMTDVIVTKSGGLNSGTYEAIQTVFSNGNPGIFLFTSRLEGLSMGFIPAFLMLRNVHIAVIR